MTDDEVTTVIGSTIEINGEIKSAEDISVLGKIQGRVETSADLFVEEGGIVEASVRTRNIDIRGAVVALEGGIEATDRFEVHNGGSVKGNVRALRIVLEDGSKYNGYMEVTANDNPPPGTGRHGDSRGALGGTKHFSPLKKLTNGGSASERAVSSPSNNTATTTRPFASQHPASSASGSVSGSSTTRDQQTAVVTSVNRPNSGNLQDTSELDTRIVIENNLPK